MTVIVGSTLVKMNMDTGKLDYIEIESKNYTGVDTSTQGTILESFNGSAESLKWGDSELCKNILLADRFEIRSITAKECKLKSFIGSDKCTLLFMSSRQGSLEIDIDKELEYIDSFDGEITNENNIFLFIDSLPYASNRDPSEFTRGILGASVAGLIVLIETQGTGIIDKVVELAKQHYIGIEQTVKGDKIKLVNMQDKYKDMYIYT